MADITLPQLTKIIIAIETILSLITSTIIIALHYTIWWLYFIGEKYNNYFQLTELINQLSYNQLRILNSLVEFRLNMWYSFNHFALCSI